MQEVWRTRQVPQEWRNATLIPLLNKKGRKHCSNYRGISLLSLPGKLLALLLLERQSLTCSYGGSVWFQKGTQHCRSELGNEAGSGKSNRAHDPIRKLKPFQMRCLQDVLRPVHIWCAFDSHSIPLRVMRNRVRNTDILERTGVLPVEEQLRQRRLQWFGHLGCVSTMVWSHQTGPTRHY